MSRLNEPNQPGQGSPGSATEQLRETAHQVGADLRDLGQQTRQAAAEQYGRLRDSAGECLQQGRERAKQWRDNLEDYVREQPVKSLLIAAGVGILLGVLWRR